MQPRFRVDRILPWQEWDGGQAPALPFTRKQTPTVFRALQGIITCDF